MIIEKYTITQLVEVEELDQTVRGDGGFGSTGVKAFGEESLSKKRVFNDITKSTIDNN